MTRDEEIERLNNLYKLVSGTEDRIELERKLSSILQDQNSSISGYIASQKQIQQKLKERKNLENTILNIQKELSKLNNLKKLTKLEQERKRYLNEWITKSSKTLNLMEQEVEAMRENANLGKAFGNSLADAAKELFKSTLSLRSIYDYFIEFDGQVKKFNLSLGVSGERARLMREEMRGAVEIAHLYGAGIADIIEMQQKMAEITGFAKMYNEKDIANMVAMSKGTSLNNQEIGELTGRLELLGYTVDQSRNLVQRSVNEFSKLGLNSSKILRNLAQNIDKLDKYRFNNGVEGLKNLLKYSEQFKLSLDSTLNATEKFNNLEGLLENGAKLMVLGGEFSKIDPFRLSFLARNKPDEFNKELAKLNKGIAVFNKETGQFDVSAIDMDRLRLVAESTGVKFEELIQSSKTLAKNQIIGKQFFGNQKDRELINSLAQINKNGKATVTIGGNAVVEISKLTTNQIELLRQQEKTLEARARDSQTFNDALTNLINQFKASLLPILEIVNVALGWFNTIIDKFRDETGKLTAWGTALGVGGLLFGTIGFSVMKTMIVGLAGLFTSHVGSWFDKFKSSSTIASSASSVAGTGAATAANYTYAASIAAVGVAAVGIGFGIKLATEGIAQLANAFKGLNPDQINGINDALITLGITFVGAVAASAALGAALAGPQGLVVGLGALAAGGILITIGASLGLVAMSVGRMGEGLAQIKNSNASEEILNLYNNFKNLSAIKPIDLEDFSDQIKMIDTSLKTLNLSNLEPLKYISNIVDDDVKRLKQITDSLIQLKNIDLGKLSEVAKILKNQTLKVEWDRNSTPVLENKIAIELGGETFFKTITKEVSIRIKKGANYK